MEKTKITSDLLPVYDYIIVGAGSAGCVLAARLTEDTNRTALLLEAGGDDQEYPEIKIPAFASALRQTEVDWAYKTVPQEHSCKGLVNRQSLWPRGKVIGGSGSLNFLVYMRGTPQDFDLWKNMGCDGWGYEDVLPYFIKSEDCRIPELIEEGIRGTEGPLAVNSAKFSPLADVFLKAGEELGYKVTDNNGRDPIGVMTPQINTDDGARAHTAQAFLRPAMHRENLHISSHCHVTKVLIDNNVARAVEFTRKGQSFIVRFKREIILSGGTIGSPQLLMLSGIGPKEHLDSLGIPVVADLPVGNLLQDHVTTSIGFDIDEPISITEEVLMSEEVRHRYDTMRSGPLSAPIIEGTALVRTKRQSMGDPNPGIQLLALPAGFSASGKVNAGINDEQWKAVLEPSGKYGIAIIPLLCHPKSRGTIRLRSSDPLDAPLIDPNYFSHPDDAKTLAEGAKLALSFANTNAYKSIGTRYSGRVLAGYEGEPFTDEYWEEYVKTLTGTIFHPCGTCRMGRADDSTTVTDPQLRVKGVWNLRVVDASIMPEITSANINAPTIMIAEKAADMIRGRQPRNKPRF